MKTKRAAKGFTFVEIMLSLAILAVSVFAFTSGMGMVFSHTAKSSILSQGLFLEAHIISSLGSYEIYEAEQSADRTYRDVIRAGEYPEGLSIPLNGVTVARVGTVRHLNRNFQSCSPGSTGCHFIVEMDVRCFDGAGEPCFAAFWIRMENIPGNIVSLRALGQRSSADGFARGDYIYPIHFERAVRERAVICPIETPALLGFNPETGEPVCRAVPDPDCSEGTLFGGFRVVDGQIEARCNPTRVAECPNPFGADYAEPYCLSSVTMGVKSGVLGFYDGECVFCTEPEGPQSVEPTYHEMSGRPFLQTEIIEFSTCPAPYYVPENQPTGCQVRAVNSWRCKQPEECAGYEEQPVLDGDGNPVTDGEGNVVTETVCTGCVRVYPNYLTAELIETRPRTATTNETYVCEVFLPAQPPEYLGRLFRVTLDQGDGPCIWDPDLDIQERVPAEERIIN